MCVPLRSACHIAPLWQRKPNTPVHVRLRWRRTPQSAGVHVKGQIAEVFFWGKPLTHLVWFFAFYCPPAHRISTTCSNPSVDSLIPEKTWTMRQTNVPSLLAFSIWVTSLGLFPRCLPYMSKQLNAQVLHGHVKYFDCNVSSQHWICFSYAAIHSKGRTSYLICFD